MRKSKYLLISILILSVILLGACNLPFAESTEDADATTIAATAAAVFTHAAETAAVTLSTATTAPETNATAALPTKTQISTVSPVTATKTPLPCNRASFVKDVTIPDGKEIASGATFTKTWRLKNNGSCTWTSGYVLLFDSGDQMGAPATSSISAGTVAPGATVDISVDLTAPASPGTYRGNFKLRSGDNIVFGINADGQGPFYVEIVVPAPVPTATNTPLIIVTIPPITMVVSGPDLIITEHTISPNPPTSHQNVTVKVGVYNQGNVASGASVLEWWAKDTFLSPACTWSIPSIVPNGGLVKTCTFVYNSWYPSATAKAIADASGTVAESNENNNESTLTYQVKQ